MAWERREGDWGLWEEGAAWKSPRLSEVSGLRGSVPPLSAPASLISSRASLQRPWAPPLLLSLSPCAQRAGGRVAQRTGSKGTFSQNEPDFIPQSPSPINPKEETCPPSLPGPGFACCAWG